MLTLLLTVALGADCELRRLDSAISRAESAYLVGDRGTLDDQLLRVEELARCVQLGAERAHRVHVIRSLTSAVANDWERTTALLRGAVASHPLQPLPDSLAGDPRLSLALTRAQEAPYTWTPAQPAWRNGLVRSLTVDAPELRLDDRLARSGRGLRVAAIATGVAAAGLYGGAWAARGRYDRVRGGDKAQVQRAWWLTNGLGGASIGAGAAAATMLTISVVR